MEEGSPRCASRLRSFFLLGHLKFPGPIGLLSQCRPTAQLRALEKNTYTIPDILYPSEGPASSSDDGAAVVADGAFVVEVEDAVIGRRYSGDGLTGDRRGAKTPAPQDGSRLEHQIPVKLGVIVF